MKYSIATWTFLFGQYAKAPWPIEKILEWTAKAGFASGLVFIIQQKS